MFCYLVFLYFRPYFPSVFSVRIFRPYFPKNSCGFFKIIAPGERALNSRGYNIHKINTTSIQYVERIFERRRGFRISGEKLLILKKGPGLRRGPD